ncbi:hypothetical protein AS52_00240 [Priestia megaterium Q3]|uniref:Uncharacterized protein n=1 Tax=Priestia megaterium Q3 TaxID=1452722 RepID=A0A806TBK2_PRIMG|nr:hypothetical protein [Priestia megaterium]AKP75261.1 hypothetical protein AS52_00240 [Priestia megaterium Q3]
MKNKYEVINDKISVIYAYDSKGTAYKIKVDTSDIERIASEFKRINVYRQDKKLVANGYVRGKDSKTTKRLHRFIMDAKQNELVQLVNPEKDPLDMCKDNLIKITRGKKETSKLTRKPQVQAEETLEISESKKDLDKLDISFKPLSSTLILSIGSSKVELKKDEAENLKKALAKMVF